jgi:hypothetical protein
VLSDRRVNKRTAIPRVIRAATAGAIGLAAVGQRLACGDFQGGKPGAVRVPEGWDSPAGATISQLNRMPSEAGIAAGGGEAVAVMATVAKGYDLDCAWRAVGEAYRGAGYYLAAAEAGEPPGTWWSTGAERPGLARGRRVERVSGLCALRRDGRI